MKRNTFKHNGLGFAYYQTGSGEKDLFLQHGYSDYSLCWGNLPEDLGKNYRVTMMDARGHGHSAKPEGGYDLDTMAGDMIALIEYLDIKEPVIIGHSMGGSLAAHLAAMTPHLLGGAVLIDPAFRIRTNEVRDDVVSDRLKEMEALKKMSVEEIANSIRAKHSDWPEIFINPAAEGKLLMSLNVVEVIRSIDATWQADLKTATCPMLLITADESAGAIVSEATSGYIRSNHPDVEILYIPGAGHSIQREKYAETLRGIEVFLSKIF